MRTTRIRTLLGNIVSAAVLCGGVSCGLAEDPRDEDLKHQYITFSDTAFKAWCLREVDVNGDGRISRYEARQMRHIDCSDCGVESLWEIGEFLNLKSLDCSGNALTELRLDDCTQLRGVDCSRNRLVGMSVDHLRLLTELRCADNRLSELDVHGNSSLRYLDCRNNLIGELNVALCAPQMETVDARSNRLTVFYRGAGQSIRALKLDDHSVVVE